MKNQKKTFVSTLKNSYAKVCSNRKLPADKICVTK